MGGFTREQLAYLEEPPSRMELVAALYAIQGVANDVVRLAFAESDEARIGLVEGLFEHRDRIAALQRKFVNCGVDPETRG